MRTAILARKMPATCGDHRRGLKEFGLVLVAAAILTATLMYPVAFKLGRVGRVDNGDGRLSIWNVAWVARTLAYPENNLGAGALAVPVYWATRNPYAAHNFALLLAFVLSATGAYYRVRSPDLVTQGPRRLRTAERANDMTPTTCAHVETHRVCYSRARLMRILHTAQMREADRRTIEVVVFPSLLLMENAGRHSWL